MQARTGRLCGVGAESSKLVRSVCTIHAARPDGLAHGHQRLPASACRCCQFSYLRGARQSCAAHAVAGGAPVK